MTDALIFTPPNREPLDERLSRQLTTALDACTTCSASVEAGDPESLGPSVLAMVQTSLMVVAGGVAQGLALPFSLRVLRCQDAVNAVIFVSALQENDRTRELCRAAIAAIIELQITIEAAS